MIKKIIIDLKCLSRVKYHESCLGCKLGEEGPDHEKEYKVQDWEGSDDRRLTLPPATVAHPSPGGSDDHDDGISADDRHQENPHEVDALVKSHKGKAKYCKPNKERSQISKLGKHQPGGNQIFFQG